MKWVELDLKMSMDALHKLGYFLGRYEEVYGGPDFLLMPEKKVYAIRYYYSHFTKNGRLHIQTYPPLMACQEVENHNVIRLTHYMIIEEPKDIKNTK